MFKFIFYLLLAVILIPLVIGLLNPELLGFLTLLGMGLIAIPAVNHWSKTH